MQVFFTKNSKNQYWTKEVNGGGVRLIFFSYSKPIFFWDVEQQELCFIRSGWSATTARHAKLAIEQWDSFFGLGLMSAIETLIKTEKLRNFKGFLEGTRTLSLRGGKILFLPHRYGDGLLGYFE